MTQHKTPRRDGFSASFSNATATNEGKERNSMHKTMTMDAMQREFASVRTKQELEALISKVFGKLVDVEFVMPENEPEELSERMVQFSEFIAAADNRKEGKE